MLKYKHPKREYVPPVQLSLSQLGELCARLLASWTHGETPSYLVTFRGADGSEISTADVALIDPGNDRVPSIIEQPTITASIDDDTIELAPQIVPSTTLEPAKSFYVLAVTGSTEQWSEGVMGATLRWLQRQRTPLFRFYYPIFIGITGLGIVGLATGMVFGISGPSAAPHVTGLGIRLFIAGIAFIVAGMSFGLRVPRFSIVVRPARNYLTIVNVALLVGIIEGLLSIYSIVAKAVGR